jgi:hypothetical protein
MRGKLLGRDYEEFEQQILTVTRSIQRVSSKRGGVDPFISLLQRHYLSQKSPGIVDALIKFNPLTSKSSSRSGQVKRQPQWLHATYDALRHRRSNLQFQIGADLSYAECHSVRTKAVVDVATDIWVACKPIIDVMLRAP